MTKCSTTQKLDVLQNSQYFLDIPSVMICQNSQGAFYGLIGNFVKIGNGPAAVIGDETCKNHFRVITRREGAGSRMIRESEDLP